MEILYLSKSGNVYKQGDYILSLHDDHFSQILMAADFNNKHARHYVTKMLLKINIYIINHEKTVEHIENYGDFFHHWAKILNEPLEKFNFLEKKAHIFNECLYTKECFINFLMFVSLFNNF